MSGASPQVESAQHNKSAPEVAGPRKSRAISLDGAVTLEPTPNVPRDHAVTEKVGKSDATHHQHHGDDTTCGTRHYAAHAKLVRCDLAPESAEALALILANPVPRPRPSPPVHDFTANMRANNFARHGYHDEDDEASDGSDEEPEEEPDTAAPVPSGCAPVDACSAVVRVLSLAVGPRGHFSQALARRSIGILDLLHRDLVAVRAPIAKNALKRFKAKLDVSVLVLARSARSVRGLVLRSGQLQEQHADASVNYYSGGDDSGDDEDSGDGDGDMPWPTVEAEDLIPPAPSWVALALAKASATHAAARKDLQPPACSSSGNDFRTTRLKKSDDLATDA